MSSAAEQKRMEAACRREERESRQRQKELERLLKQHAKLSAQEQARLEVETFENSLEVLLSIHKEVSPNFDWMESLCVLPPHKPMNADSTAFDAACAEVEKMRLMAKDVLAGNVQAYGKVLAEFSPFSELASLGTSIDFCIHPKLIECGLHVNGRAAIPTETKSLTVAGKVAVKTMPKNRFHEVYQDYVCGCLLRVAREVLALLPVDAVIVTASITSLQMTTGKEVETAVLSVVMPRQIMEQLDFERLDPSDSMKNFLHRGDVMASRKANGFSEIVPLNPEDLANEEPAKLGLTDLLNHVRKLRAEISAKLKQREPEALTLDEMNLPET